VNNATAEEQAEEPKNATEQVIGGNSSAPDNSSSDSN
jgi:hypothetical protein